MFPIIELRGDAEARGLAYGQAARALIAHSIASYARLFAYRRGIDWHTAQDAALTYLPLLEDAAPEQVAEMRAIAQGSAQPFGAILALNARTELLAGKRPPQAHPDYEAAMARNRESLKLEGQRLKSQAEISTFNSKLSSSDFGECTTVAAQPGMTADGHALLAQTWDWTGDQRAACVVLRIGAPGQPEILTVTEAGILAKIGLNSAGLAVSLNILGSRSDGQTPGMPVHVLLRRLLDCRDASEADAEVRRVRPGASSCVTVATAAGGLTSYELTPGAIGAVHAADGLLWHTNHCLVAETAADETPLPLISSSEPRLSRAGTLLGAAGGAVTVDALTAILRDETDGPNAICRRPDLSLPPTERVESVLGVVLDCTARVMHLAPDIPADVPFTPIAL